MSQAINLIFVFSFFAVLSSISAQTVTPIQSTWRRLPSYGNQETYFDAWVGFLQYRELNTLEYKTPKVGNVVPEKRIIRIYKDITAGAIDDWKKKERNNRDWDNTNHRGNRGDTDHNHPDWDPAETDPDPDPENKYGYEWRPNWRSLANLKPNWNEQQKQYDDYNIHERIVYMELHDLINKLIYCPKDKGSNSTILFGTLDWAFYGYAKKHDEKFNETSFIGVIEDMNFNLTRDNQKFKEENKNKTNCLQYQPGELKSVENTTKVQFTIADQKYSIMQVAENNKEKAHYIILPQNINITIESTLFGSVNLTFVSMENSGVNNTIIAIFFDTFPSYLIKGDLLQEEKLESATSSCPMIIKPNNLTQQCNGKKTDVTQKENIPNTATLITLSVLGGFVLGGVVCSVLWHFNGKRVLNIFKKKSTD